MLLKINFSKFNHRSRVKEKSMIRIAIHTSMDCFTPSPRVCATTMSVLDRFHLRPYSHGVMKMKVDHIA